MNATVRTAYEEAVDAFTAAAAAARAADAAFGTPDYAAKVAAYKIAATRSRIKADTVAYLTGTDNATTMLVQPPKGWDSIEA